MFYYVEFLRATRALRIVGIIMGVMLLVAIVFRISFGHGFAPNDDFATALERSPSAHVTRTRLPNGDTRVVVDDPARQVHAVIERQGEAGSVTKIDVRTGGRDHQSRTFTRVTTRDRSGTTATSDGGGTSHTITSVGPGSDFWWGAFFAATIPIGLLVATILAGPLAKENDGHLELAWTKPVSRERYALAAAAIDATAIVLAQVATLVTVLLASALWAIPRFGFEPEAAVQIGLALAAPIAWYGCLTALSASMKRGPGAMIGVGWVVAIIAPAIASGTQNAREPALKMINAVSTGLSYVDPIAYVWFQGRDSVVALARSESTALAVLAALAVLYVAVAVAQWRRVEA